MLRAHKNTAESEEVEIFVRVKIQIQRVLLQLLWSAVFLQHEKLQQISSRCSSVLLLLLLLLFYIKAHEKEAGFCTIHSNFPRLKWI